jgi:hypothetical protein
MFGRSECSNVVIEGGSRRARSRSDAAVDAILPTPGPAEAEEHPSAEGRVLEVSDRGSGTTQAAGSAPERHRDPFVLLYTADVQYLFRGKVKLTESSY